MSMSEYCGKVFELSPSKRHRSWRKGFGVFSFDSDGRLFIHPGLIGLAGTGWMCASHDGQPLCVTKKATLVPHDWAIRERPDLTDDLCKLRVMCESEASRIMESEVV
jgi:hypothetical protein